MSSGVEEFKALLRQSGQSVTRTRLAVFMALLGQEPLSMAALIRRAGDVDRASVYRSVELFERLGIVQRLNSGWKYKLELSDTFAPHHHHLTCTTCGRSIAINEHELEHTIDALAREHGFRPAAHQVEVQGTCRECCSAAMA